MEPKNRRRPQNPRTPKDWQNAVDAAAACRALADCMLYNREVRGGLYGLINGPRINTARCDELLEEGQRRNIRPSKPVTDLAIDLLIEWTQLAILSPASWTQP